MQKNNNTIFLVTGGTGGHFFPALAVAQKDKKNKYIAYALSVEIMMVEENFTNEKLRLLELLEKNFEINDLESASIKYTIKTKYSD